MKRTGVTSGDRVSTHTMVSNTGFKWKKKQRGERVIRFGLFITFVYTFLLFIHAKAMARGTLLLRQSSSKRSRTRRTASRPFKIRPTSRLNVVEFTE